ncbi:M48 family metallopeptidase [Conexibacter sp. SYSU D00693]|uniref:M48 family metallopeptidase n=1 Tax=Conexibacter sp. SYSU D00693 TaxID=2812560 RepID=UPI00196B29AD|nr:SprT family zinc-dependent metalloprotease [Conexibacter sp. SYSU D00693]
MASELAYSIRRSSRARRVGVRVDPRDGAVEVVLPTWARVRDAEAAVVELRPWIDRRLAEAAAARAHVEARGSTVPYLGTALELVPEHGRTRVHRRGDVLLVPAGDARAALERWYRRQARAELVPRVDAATAALGVSYTSLTVRDQRTRWGSCTSKGGLSFNWRLLLAPEAVLDYVVWHEACHLVVLDHSTRFWSLLGSHLPGYAEPQRWLRRHGATLVL